MIIKVIVLDLDGTLFDTRTDIVNAVNAARSSLGLAPLEFDRVVAMVGNGIKVLAERAFRDSTVTPEESVETLMRYYGPHSADTAQLYPGVRETLPLFGRTLVVVSNKPKALVDDLLEKNGIRHYFDYVAGGDSFEKPKPDTAPIKFIKDRYGVSSDEILVVGDHSPDVEMAEQADAHSVYCNYGFFGRDTVGAEFQIDSFPELLEILAGEGRHQGTTQGRNRSEAELPGRSRRIGGRSNAHKAGARRRKCD